VNLSKVLCDVADLNYIEDSGGGPDLTVGIFPKLDKVSLLQVCYLTLSQCAVC